MLQFLGHKESDTTEDRTTATTNTSADGKGRLEGVAQRPKIDGR